VNGCIRRIPVRASHAPRGAFSAAGRQRGRVAQRVSWSVLEGGGGVGPKRVVPTGPQGKMLVVRAGCTPTAVLGGKIEQFASPCILVVAEGGLGSVVTLKGQ
jgi:hypothetical protein